MTIQSNYFYFQIEYKIFLNWRNDIVRCFCARKCISQKNRTKLKNQFKCISNYTGPRKKTLQKSQVLYTTIWNENGRESQQDWLNICPRVLRTHFMTMVQLHVEARSKAASGFLSRRGHNDAVSLNLFVNVYGGDSKRFWPFRLQASFKRSCCDDNNHFCTPAFHHKVIAVALTLCLRPGKTSKRVGKMLPETISANTCFPNVAQFFQKRSSVSGSKKCFCSEARTCFAARNNVPRVAKLGNIGETCVRSKCFWQHVSGSFFQGLSINLW